MRGLLIEEQHNNGKRPINKRIHKDDMYTGNIETREFFKYEKNSLLKIVERTKSFIAVKNCISN